MRCQKCNGELTTGMYCPNCSLWYSLDFSSWKYTVPDWEGLGGIFGERKYFAGTLFGIPIYCNSEQEVIELGKRLKSVFWVSEYESREP